MRQGFLCWREIPIVMFIMASSVMFLAACVPNTVKPTNPMRSAVIEAPADQRQLVLGTQLMLQEKGFNPGPIDGIDGPLTRSALREFQEARGFPPTRSVNKEAYYQLSADGDVTPDPGRDLSSSQRLRSDSNFVNQSYLQACGVGLLTGAILGRITARNSDEAKKRMLVGGSVGCAAAMGANYWLQGERERAVYKEEDMQQILTALEDENRKLTRLVNTSKEVVSEDRKKIAEIDAAYRSKQISLEEAKKEMVDVDDNRTHLEKTLITLEERKKDWQQLGSKLRSSQSGSQVKAIDSEITNLERKIDVLKADLASLEQARRVSAIG